jgi:hypothetical protein
MPERLHRLAGLDPSELDANGQLVPNGDAEAPALGAYNSECPDPMVCKNGVCRLECGEFGARCDYPSDCNRPLRCGPRGTCVLECSTTFDCAADECCQDHR